MSLFPAYGSSVEKNEGGESSLRNVEDETARPSWLNIESFPVNVIDIPLPNEAEPRKDEREIEECHVESERLVPEPLSVEKEKSAHKRKPKKKEHIHRRKEVEVKPTEKNEDIVEDKEGVRGYLTVKTLTRPLVPQYFIKFRCIGKKVYNVSKKKAAKYRYFIQTELLPEKAPEHMKEGTSSSETFSGYQLEDELTAKTAEFNRILTADPGNVDKWLEYAKFQDTVQQFEKAYRRGGSAKSVRVTTERKISILDKALQENPECERLLQERFQLAEQLYPADSLVQQLEKMVERSPRSVVLWRSYIRTLQGSLSLCNTTSVLKLYDQGMKKFHQLRRGAPSADTLPMENAILDLLLDCGLFLRQAGLWEQLWTLFRLYLELNLAQPNSDLFRDIKAIPEDYIAGLEETILSSQLPLPELWYRIERLREGVHWLPWSSEEECEDPQRVVFVDDVSDMLHPITTPSLSFRIALITLIVLKVPSLPSSHTALQVIGMNHIPSNLDCVEMLLVMYYPQNTIVLQDRTFLQGALNLVYGPQYLSSSWPGQEEYLDFVMKVFHSSAVCLKEPLRTALYVWWLRFERYLYVLDKIEHSKLPVRWKKKIKSSMKDFLKKEQNRNNSLYYVEYALFEYESGQRESACKVLNTAIAAQGSVPVISVLNKSKKAELCRLHRVLCEVLLDKRGEEISEADAAKSRQQALTVLLALGMGISMTQVQQPVDVQLFKKATDKFRHISTELLLEENSEAADGTEHLLPNFTVDWITCYAWWMFLTHSIWEAGAVFEQALEKLPAADTPNTMPVLVSTCQRESLFESYVGLLYYYCKKNAGVYSVLQEVLHRALREFPNNLHLLSVIANCETTLGYIGGSWWKMTKYFNDSSSQLVQVFQVFFLRYQGGLLQLAAQRSHDFLGDGGPVIVDPCMKNRLTALYSRLLSDSRTKRCPMLWRLYLRFLAEQGKESSYHSTFYRAVEECPWVKVLYVESVKLLPAELPQLQDLLIEKELRVHVTPEELDILRNDPAEPTESPEPVEPSKPTGSLETVEPSGTTEPMLTEEPMDTTEPVSVVV